MSQFGSAGRSREAPRGGVYRPRNPRVSSLWRCAQRHSMELRVAGRFRRAVEERTAPGLRSGERYFKISENVGTRGC